MAGTITALKIQKRNRERVNIFLDEKYAFAVTLSAAISLGKGQYLTDTEIEELKDKDRWNKAYQQALRYLGYRPRTEAEMRKYLSDKAYPASIVEGTIHRLTTETYLDDEAFVQWWLEHRARHNPRGAYALRYELQQKGVSSQLIDQALHHLEEDELAWAAVEKKLYRWQNLDERTFKQKVIGFLSRRGFDYGITYEISCRAWTSLHVSE